MGVPVRRSLLRHWKPRSVFHRTLAEFLIFCASSKIMYCHLTRWKYCWSWVTYKKCEINKNCIQEKIYKLIAGYENVERCILIVADFLLTPELPQCCSVLDVTPIGNCFQLRHEASQ